MCLELRVLVSQLCQRFDGRGIFLVEIMKKYLLSPSKGVIAGWIAGVVIYNKAKSKHCLGNQGSEADCLSQFPKLCKIQVPT